jgi:hypothetical protein
MIWYPRALLAVFAFVLVYLAAVADGAEVGGRRIGGDFPAFYGAGTILADGNSDDLYDADFQQASQEGLFPFDPDGTFLYFSYPPYVAAVYRPLAAMPYGVGYLTATVGMAAALVGAVWLARSLLTVVHRWPEATLAAAVVFPPMWLGLFGGQNVALSLLLIVGAWRALVADRAVLAGAVLGLMFYKPQFALPLIGLVFISGRYRVLIGAVGTAAAAYVASAVVAGLAWPSDWWRQVTDFNSNDVDVNGDTALSFWGFFGGQGLGAAVAVASTIGLSALLAWMWWRRPNDLAANFAITAAALPMIALHAQSYEASLLLISAAVLADRLPVSRARWLVLVWVANGLFLFSDVGINFAFLAVAGTLLWAFAELGVRPRAPQRAST